jgi:shikimate dehydrogenase
MRAAVLGKPIAHSLSPALHLAAYRALGLADWSYTAIECVESELPSFVASCGPDWAGLSLTMPLKRTALTLLDHADPGAVTTGGANTMVFRDGQRWGYNTDVPGIVTALAEADVKPSGDVTILGGGATACSTVAALSQLGVSRADVVVRAPSRAGALLAAAESLGFTVRLTDAPRPAPGLLISTLPAGAADKYAGQVRASALAPAAVMDVVYASWPTPLAAASAAAGVTVVSGFAMLLHQAAEQVELMTGRDAPVEVMRAAGERALADDMPDNS